MIIRSVDQAVIEFGSHPKTASIVLLKGPDGKIVQSIGCGQNKRASKAAALKNIRGLLNKVLELEAA